MKKAKYWEFSLGKRYIVTGIFIIIIMIILSFFGEFYLLIDKNIRTDTENFLTEHTGHRVSIINSTIDESFSTLEAIAAFIGEYDDITDQRIMQILHNQTIKSDFTRMAVTTPDGISHTDDGKVHETSDRLYFQRAIKGEKNLSDIIISVIDGNEVIVFAVPIYREGNVVGVLRSTADAKMFDGILDVQSVNGQGASYIIQSDGALLTKTPDMINKNRNYFDLLEQAKIQDKVSLQEFKDNMQKGMSGSLHYLSNGKSYYANYAPLGINNWYVLTIVPSEVMQSKAANISKLVLSLIIKEFFALMLLFFYVLFLERRQIRHVYESNQKLEALASNIPGGVFRYTADEKEIMHFVSDGLLKLFGYTEKEFRDTIGNIFPNMIHEEDRHRVICEIEEQRKIGYVQQVEYRIVNAWGYIRWVMHRGQLVTDSNGNTWFYVLVTDITDNKRTQEELRLNEERYRIVAESSSSIIFECDAKDKTVTFLSRGTERYGYSPAIDNFPEGFVHAKIIHEDDVSDFYEYCHAIKYNMPKKPVEVRCFQKDGTYRWCTLQLTPIYDDKHNLLKEIGRISDIDTEKKETDMLREQSIRDPLTGLYNKSQTEVIINAYLKKEGKDKAHAFLFIDIDNFKAVNDNLGHLFGDSVLKGISSRINELFHNTDIAGRVGGDEFVVFLKDTGTRESIREKAGAICDIFKNAYTGDHKEYKISGSIGIALYKKDGANYHELFIKADRALYYAKKTGKDRFEFYMDHMSL